ncbi:MAG TPA: hypothetical protein VNZ45_05045, partial [Bacteroidia bacterium]|nr:hypothetical protein [Bacteroidia bacterium]
TFFFAIIIIVSCNKGVPPSEYVKYVENPKNGLKVKEDVNGVGYILQYEPVAYCVMLEKRSFTIPDDEFKKEYDRFKGLEHYTFRIDKTEMDSLVNKLGDTSKYKKGVAEYFDFWIQKDIKMVMGNDTIPCSICQPDANTGMSQYYTFSLGFSYKNDPEAQTDRHIVFNNKILHTGNITLCVKGKYVKSIPVLKMM